MDLSRSAPSRHSEAHITEKPTMKTLLQMIASLLICRETPSPEERYLALAVDAHDLEVRLLALERARP